MIAALILLIIGMIVSSSLNWYQYIRGKQLQLSATRVLNHAASEIDYLEARRDELQQVIAKTNYNGCAEWLEKLAKARPDGKLQILTGQSEGLSEAASFLRQEAKRIGMRRK